MSELCILVADDDAEDRFILADAFKEIGRPDVLHFAVDGADLLLKLETVLVHRPQLIILDLNMPRLNGTETLSRLKAHPQYAGIPVIIFSTSVNEIEKQSCLSLGAYEYLTKPANYLASLNVATYFVQFAQKQTHLASAEI